MSELFSNLIAGVLANLISDGIGSATKYVLSNHEMDLELRKSINNLYVRQQNIEGTIEQLVNNQALLLSIFVEIIKAYQLKTQVYIENENIIIIPNYEDASILNEYNTNMVKTSLCENVDADKFDSYRKYVKKMRDE